MTSDRPRPPEDKDRPRCVRCERHLTVPADIIDPADEEHYILAGDLRYGLRICDECVKEPDWFIGHYIAVAYPVYVRERLQYENALLKSWNDACALTRAAVARRASA